MQVSEASPAIRWVSAARTDTGIVRKLNEDSVLDAPAQRLWCVADGMGGHDSGEVASQLIVSTLAGTTLPPRLREAVDVLDAQIQEVNRDLRDRGDSQGKLIGSTVVLTHAIDNLLAILWAGDSRAYLFREGRCHRLTRDHSQIEELLELHTGSVSGNHVQSNAITRAVGAEDTVVVDVDVVQVMVGDWVLLCSDGLGKHVTDAELVGFTADGSPQAMVDKLIETVLERGAVDNVSVIAVHAEAAEGDTLPARPAPSTANYTPINLNSLRLEQLRGEIDGETYRERRRPVLDDIDAGTLAASPLQVPGSTTKPAAPAVEAGENPAFMQTQILNVSRTPKPKAPAAVETAPQPTVTDSSVVTPPTSPATTSGWRKYAAGAVLLAAAGSYFGLQQPAPVPAPPAITVKPIAPATAALATLEAFVRQPEWTVAKLEAANEALGILKQETTPSTSATTATGKLRDLVLAQWGSGSADATPERAALAALATSLGLDTSATAAPPPAESPPTPEKATTAKHAHKPAHVAKPHSKPQP